MIFLPLESPAFLLENPYLLFLASLLLLCPSCGISAVADSLLLWAVDGSLQVLLASLLLPPTCCSRCCCWFLTLVGVPAVADSLLSGVPAVPDIYTVAPCCCWLVHGCFWRPCCCWFPTAIGVCAVVAFLLLTSPIFPSQNGSKRNSEKFSVLQADEIPTKKPVSFVRSVFRGIISWSENGNPKINGAESRIKKN
jgi:hypothetical protein